MPGNRATIGFIRGNLSDHLVPDMPWRNEQTCFTRIFHLLELELNELLRKICKKISKYYLMSPFLHRPDFFIALVADSGEK